MSIVIDKPINACPTARAIKVPFFSESTYAISLIKDPAKAIDIPNFNYTQLLTLILFYLLYHSEFVLTVLLSS
jgi:hypothetical protein